jgi:hypothetical protein
VQTRLKWFVTPSQGESRVQVPVTLLNFLSSSVFYEAVSIYE